jgi:hypothetical protein
MIIKGAMNQGIFKTDIKLIISVFQQGRVIAYSKMHSLNFYLWHFGLTD